LTDSSSSAGRSRWAQSFGRLTLHDVVATVLCLAAFAVAWAAVHDLEWPCESDLYRDLGVAQALVNGEPGGDPAYAGELGWYPPAVPAVVAAVSVASGLPLHRTYTVAGVYLNLLSPAAFYVLVAYLFGRRAALASLAGFLFLGPQELMSWMHATYSPWLWSCNLAQAFFYAGLAATVSALRAGGPWRLSLAGSTLGVLALAHPAPTLTLSAVLVLGVVREAFVSGPRSAALRTIAARAGSIGALGLAIAAPFWLPLFVRYAGAVRNPVPLTWVAAELAVDRVGDFLLRVPSFRAGVALLGLFGLWWRRSDGAGPSRWAILAWLGAAASGLGYGYATQRFGALPPLLPSWHFYFSLQAVESVAFGLGVTTLATGLSVLLSRLRRMPAALRPAPSRVADVAIALVLLVVAFRWNGYASRPDLVANRDSSKNYARLPELELYRWVLKETESSDVVLGEPIPSFFIAAAGRKVVALQDLFSSPYVNPAPRLRDSAQMLEHLEAGREREFYAAANEYGVRYVAARAPFGQKLRNLRCLDRVFRSKDRKAGLDVFRVEEPDLDAP
jgi:hypothetical protein